MSVWQNLSSVQSLTASFEITRAEEVKGVEVKREETKPEVGKLEQAVFSSKASY